MEQNIHNGNIMITLGEYIENYWPEFKYYDIKTKNYVQFEITEDLDVKGTIVNDSWISLETRIDYDNISEKIKGKNIIYGESIISGNNIKIKDSFIFESKICNDVKIENSVVINNSELINCKVINNSLIRSSKIENSSIELSIIKDGPNFHDFSHVKDANILKSRIKALTINGKKIRSNLIKRDVIEKKNKIQKLKDVFKEIFQIDRNRENEIN